MNETLTINTKEPVIWEEKNLIEAVPNSNNCGNNMTAIIIKNTEPESEKNECESIGKKWVKNCPNCGRKQFYCNKYVLKKAISTNVICQSCRATLTNTYCHHTSTNYIGQIFGKLTIMRQYIGTTNQTMIDCICECGKSKTFTLVNIKNGYYTSCGCARVDSLQFSNSPFKRKPSGEAAFNQVYSGYKGNAKHGRSGV